MKLQCNILNSFIIVIILKYLDHSAAYKNITSFLNTCQAGFHLQEKNFEMESRF